MCRLNSDGCCRKLCDIEDRWSFEKDQGKTLKTRRASSFLQIMISIRYNKDADKKCIDKAMLCSLVSLPKGCRSRKNAAARRGFIRHLQKHMKTSDTTWRHARGFFRHWNVSIFSARWRKLVANITQLLLYMFWSPQPCSQLSFLLVLGWVLHTRCCMVAHLENVGLPQLLIASMGAEGTGGSWLKSSA